MIDYQAVAAPPRQPPVWANISAAGLEHTELRVRPRAGTRGLAVVEEPPTTPARAKRSAANRAAVVSAGRACWGVFLLSLAGLLLTANGHHTGQDQEYNFRTARALLLERSFAIEPLNAANEAGMVGPDGRFYAHYAPGLPLLMAPVILVGRGLEGVTEGIRSRYIWDARDEADKASRFLVSYLNAPVTAATAALLALLVLRLGYPTPAAVFTALAYAFATFAWGQARVVFADPLQGLLILLGVVLLLGASPSRAALGGTALALAVLVKLTTLLVLPWVLLLPDARGRPLWRTPLMVCLVLGPSLAALALHALFNLFRFGNPFNTGYLARGSGGGEAADAGSASRVLGVGFIRSPITGLYGLLFSIGRGIVWYAPPILAAAWAFQSFARERRQVAVAIGAACLSWLLVHGFWVGWHGGWGWGPRYLLPVLPLALVALAHCWIDRRARLAALGMVLVGVLVQLPGALVDFWLVGRDARAIYLARCVNCNDTSFFAFQFFLPEASDFTLHTNRLLSGNLDLAWITFAGTWVTPVTIGLVLFLAVTGWRLLLTNAIRAAMLARATKGAAS
ncbi:MAG: hypothetical protein H0V51_01795 [Chloroflexi bacterium]|nr:hypothetical protein [Chloroflexota bacterium]